MSCSMSQKPAAVLAGIIAIQTCLTAQVSSPLLHGRVVLEDGRPPPKGLTVMSTCGILSAWRDGTFTVTSGYKARPGWQSRRCGLFVSLRGFRTVHEVLPDKDNIRVVLHRIGSEGIVPASVDLRVLECAARLGRAYGEGEASMGLREWAAAEK